MDGCYFPAKLKRKDLHDDDFSEFSLSSPATKIRRLDTELPPIIEEDEIGNPMDADTLFPNELSAMNKERAIVLYDPMNNVPLLQTRSPFSISVNSDFLSGFKNPVVWSKRSDLLQSLNVKTEKHENNSEENNGSLAVVPWVPTHTPHGPMSKLESPHTQAYEMMDADDVEATTMDIEDDNSKQIPINDIGSVNGVNQWQQHCVIPQAPSNLSTPITWSGV